MPLAALLLLFAGFAALAASQSRHHRTLFRRLPTPQAARAWRGAGWLLLAASIAPAIHQDGPAIGLVLWLGLATVAALGVTLGLTWRDSQMAPLAAVRFQPIRPLQWAMPVASAPRASAGHLGMLGPLPAVSADRLRRGRSLLFAFALHVLLLAALWSSARRFAPQLAAPDAARAVTFVLAPPSAAGTPREARRPAAAAPPASAPRSTSAIAAAPARDTPQLSTTAALSASAVASLMSTADSLAPAPAPTGSGSQHVAAPEADAAAAPELPAGRSSASRAETGAPALGAASGSSNWSGLVLGRLEQFRRYPAMARARRLEGISYVRFTIDREGRVLACALERSSGHDLLDREAVTLVRRASPLPQPPDEVAGETVTLTAPVEFFLTR